MKIFLIIFVVLVLGMWGVSYLSTDDEREIEESSGPSQKTYSVTIDYSKSLDEMIRGRAYDPVDPLVTAAHFPVRGTGIVQTDVTLVRFGKLMMAEEILKELDAMNLRPATIEYLAALGSQYPDLQLFNGPHIYAFGSQWKDEKGDVRVPAISLFMNEFRASWLRGPLMPPGSHDSESWFIALPK